MEGCFEKAIQWLISLISLAENLFTTYYLDEDKWGAIYLALIFCFEPMLDSIIKQLMFCTECDWDNFIYDLISEGVQCFLYIFFCSYSDEAKLWLPIMMAGQVGLMILLKVKEKCCDEPEEKTDEQKEQQAVMRCITWCQGNCMTLVSSLYPLFFLLYQEEAPYRQKTFEMVLAGNYWLADVQLQYQMKALEDAAGGDNSGMFRLQANKSWTVRFTTLGTMAFGVYSAVLAWMYWFSPDIEETFDKVYTMIIMVGSCLYGPCLPCIIPMILCGGGMMSAGGPGAGADIFGRPADDM